MMIHHKKIILLLLVSAILLFGNYQKLLLADSIDAFKQKDAKSQAEFINSLSKEEKFRFLQKFLPGSCFYSPPNTFMKFLSDGSALNNDPEYFYTRWSITNNSFKLWKQKPSDPFPEFKNKYVLTDLTAEYNSGYQNLLWFTFSNLKDEGLTFRYYSGCYVFKDGNNEYERYKKTLTPKERARLEQLNPPIKPSAIVDDKQPDISNYSGVYNVGVSEPWTLVIVVVDGKAYVQRKDLSPSPNGTELELKCHNFENVEIHGNKLTAKTVTGRFVIVTIERKNKKGLILNWKHDGKEELGYKYTTLSFQEYLHGKYPETFFKRLGEQDLSGKTKNDLKIMRNEIYAHYGHKFRPNGSMDKYFRSQPWYYPQNVDVSSCLTEIEKENIKFIQAHE